jgi:O-6-methylguanine DNA methyltransferase
MAEALTGTGAEVVRGLRGLHRPAPAGLLPAVGQRLGLLEGYVETDGPIGPLFVAFGPAGISLIGRGGDPGEFEEEFRLTFGRPLRRLASAPRKVQRAIDAYVWARSARRGPAPVDLQQLPDFERQVLLKTLEIPRGEVRPYAWVAAEIGRPLAVRAVGNALARNPVPFVIPCHRVVRSDGRIGQYGAGGPESKRAVLAAEGVDTDELERLPTAGVRFLGSDSTRIYCYPTCRHARRVTPRHRIAFRSVEESLRAGYRACKRCRPVATPRRAA